MSTQMASNSVNQPALFHHLRLRLLKNSLRLVLGQSFMRMLTIVLCCVFIWGSLFIGSFIGFWELANRWELPVDGSLVALFLNLSFIVLGVLLIFSTSIILYSSLFAAQETAFLLTCPVHTDQIFAYKLQGAIAYSSWAFILLGSPVLLAYGLNVGEGGAPWYFYPLMFVFFLGFVMLPGSVGAFMCLLIVNFFPRHRKHFLVAGALLLIVGVGWWSYARLLPSVRQAFFNIDAVSLFLDEFALFQNPLLPAFWMSEGLRSAATGEWLQSFYYLALLWSNGLLLYLLLTWCGRLLYRRGYNLLASGSGGQRRYGASLLDHALGWCLWFVDRPTRMLVAKDFRAFRRDPAQWAQILIFCGLALLYFFSIRSFYQQTVGMRFQNGISLLNLTATSFLICAYTGRFIYPMLSLEGKRFWILGLLPLKRSRLVWSKFAFALVGTLLVGEFLVVFSGFMLNLDEHFIILHALAIAALAFGLSGISVGMGAIMPNFRETDPSKIAVGFGGTLNLVVGLLYQIVILVFMVLPWHLMETFSQYPMRILVSEHRWLWLTVAFGMVLALLAVVLPLRTGMRALEKMEF